MNNDIKKLLVGIRQNVPDWCDDLTMSLTLTPAPPEGDIIIVMKGVPPNDVTYFHFQDDPRKMLILKNWGVTEVEALTEPNEEVS